MLIMMNFKEKWDLYVFGKEMIWVRYKLDKHFNAKLMRLQDEIWHTEPEFQFYYEIYKTRHLLMQELNCLNLKVDTKVTKLPNPNTLSKYL